MAESTESRYDSPVVDLDIIDALREKGVMRATFHDNGQIASVDFAPDDSTQHDNSSPDVTQPRRTTGGRRVPREPESADSP